MRKSRFFRGLATLAQYITNRHTFRKANVLSHFFTLLCGDIAPESGAEALVRQERLRWNVANAPRAAAILKLHGHVDKCQRARLRVRGVDVMLLDLGEHSWAEKDAELREEAVDLDD